MNEELDPSLRSGVMGNEAQVINEISLEKMTGLEREVGLDGALIAVIIDLTRGGATPHITQILETLNRDSLTLDEAISLLKKANFKRVSLQKFGFSDALRPVEDEDGDFWLRPEGKEGSSSWDFEKGDGVSTTLDEERITQLVTEHMLERPSVDFGLGPTTKIENAWDGPAQQESAVADTDINVLDYNDPTQEGGVRTHYSTR